jgi:hypothetical protein
VIVLLLSLAAGGRKPPAAALFAKEFKIENHDSNDSVLI